MEIKNIYETIDVNTPANYQIKVKGELKPLMTLVKTYKATQITSETTDPEHQIYMITLHNITQARLFELASALLHYQYPIISVICTRVVSKKSDSNGNNGDSSVAVSA